MIYEKLMAAVKDVKDELNRILGSEKLTSLLVQKNITSKENFNSLLDQLVSEDIVDILNISLQLYSLRTLEVREEYDDKLNKMMLKSHFKHTKLNDGQYVDYSCLAYCEKLIYELCLLFEVGELNITK